MSSVCRNIAFILATLFIFSAAHAQEKKPDRWFSRDKFEHFALSAVYSAGTAAVVHRHFDLDKSRSQAFGFGFTVSLGAAKEAADFKTNKGAASVKDFIWDIAGALTGAIVAGMAL